MAGIRRVDEREVRHLAEVERRHLQDDRRQMSAQYLRIGELRAGREVLLAVEPDAHAVGGAPAAALALVGRSLGNRLDRQPLDLGSLAVPGDPRGARVDHVLDAGHGQRRLRDIGGQDHAPAVRLALLPGLASGALLICFASGALLLCFASGALLLCFASGKNPVLLGGRQPCVERQHVELVPAGQGVGGVPDLPLPAEEDQDVPWPFRQQFGHGLVDALHLISWLFNGVVRVGQRPVAGLDRVGASRDLDDRCG